VEAEHNALALAADADGVLAVGVPLARLDGSLAGTARFMIRADFDLTAALRWTALVVGDWLLLTIPVALLAAAISTAVSVRAARLELNGISTAVNAWAQGDFSVRAPLSRRGELVELSQALNEMAEGLEELVALREQRLLVRERNRLARELHDTVRQQLFGLSLKAASAQANLRRQGTSAAALDGFQELIQSAQSELQRLIDHTAIDPDEGISLNDRLRKLLARIERQYGLRHELEVAAPLSLEAEQSTELYRIVQEAISNVVRHAEARQARVSIKATNAGGVLAIEDDGRGFDSGQRHAGFGLASMRARAAALPRGQLRIHARPGQGTRVEVVWQYREAA
ncbi:MAG: HAMP domain-containing protein, partial [Wenzhouxiangellaceae bacterium]